LKKILIFTLSFILVSTISEYAFGETARRYMIITNSVFCKTAPSSDSTDMEADIGFGSVILGEKVIQNETDFDYIKLSGKEDCYVPLEMTIEVPLVSFSSEKGALSSENGKDLPIFFVPNDLMPINKMYSFGDNRVLAKKSILKDLYAMLSDAKKNGHKFYVANGFKDLQVRIKEYEEAIRLNPKQTLVPKPVHSSSATGLVIDLTDNVTGSNFEYELKNDQAWKWIYENSSRYGFRTSGKSFRFEYSGEKSRRKPKTDKIFDEAINKRIEIPSLCTVHVLKNSTNKRASFIWVHHNEKSAGKTLKYALSKYGGHSIYIINGDKRNVYIPYNRRSYFIDPNRIYTPKGIEKYLDRHHRKLNKNGRRSVYKKAEKLKDTILSSIDWTEKKYLIALHSSRPGSDFSIEEFNAKNSYLTYTNPDHNPKNLFFTTSLQDYYFFKSRGYNVVYQRSIEDDGSLSIYAAKNNLPYINIEVVEGDDKFQQKMLDLVIECVNQHFKEKSL